MNAKTNVTVPSRDFQRAISVAARLINRKNALPVLADVLLK